MLRRDPFDAEDALRRVLIANCDGVLVGRGVIQSLQFIQVLELNHDNAGCGCRAFEGDGLTTAHNELAARVVNRFGYEGEVFLIVPTLVLDCDLSDVVGRRLGLSMEGLNCSSAERSARDHCQPDGDMPINHLPPDFTEAATVADPRRLARIYGIDQLGLGAPARFFGAVPQPNVAGGNRQHLHQRHPRIGSMPEQRLDPFPAPTGGSLRPTVSHTAL